MSDKAIIDVIEADFAELGIPTSEFNARFIVRMIRAMQVSYFKYGKVEDAYPIKFDAVSDIRARVKKYRETGNLHYMVDAANFAMIEGMLPTPERNAHWGQNDAADSPGRTTAQGHRLVQEDNKGERIMGEVIVHNVNDEQP